MDDTLLSTEDATDVGRFPPKPKNEVLRGLGLRPAALWKETIETGRDDMGNPGDLAETRVLASAENGRVIVPLAMWWRQISSLVASGRMTSWRGRTMDGVNLSREK
jgi:hypothetical protein